MSFKNREEAMLYLTVAKWASDRAKEMMTTAKEWLTNDMAPGVREKARLGKETVATISRAEIKTSTRYRVTDEKAYANWLTEHGQQTRWEHHLAAYLTSDAMLTALANGYDGELPDGVTVDEKTTGGYVQARISDKQRETLENNMTGATLLTVFTTRPAIEQAQNQGETSEQ